MTDLVTRRRPRPSSGARRAFARNRLALGGLIVLVLVIAITLAGPEILAVDPFDITAAPLTPPWSPDAWLGTDQQGRDILVGLIYGGRATLAEGATAACLAVIIGVGVGSVAGYLGGKTDEILMRVCAFFQILPALLFAMIAVSLFGPSLAILAIAIGAVSWPPIARIARAEFLKLKERDFVAAERMIGSSRTHIMWRVILPNALPPLVVSATFAVGSAILFEASLSFLGLSDPNQMSWGLMIGSARSYMLSCWWAVAFPGLTIFVTVVAVALIGDGLNDALDPTAQTSR